MMEQEYHHLLLQKTLNLVDGCILLTQKINLDLSENH